MREIKFRVWDKNSKVYTELQDCVVDYDNVFLNMNEIVSTNSVILEQYTGLRDINGVDIYEGDIVSALKIEYIGEIIKKASGEWSMNGYVGLYTNKCVIIGNIHENKELLEA